MKDTQIIGMHTYFKDIKANGFDKLLTPEREKELSDIINGSKNKDEINEAVNELVAHNLRLVIKIASKVASQVTYCRSISFDDLVSAGNLGLVRAAQKYNSKFGAKFATYAYFVVQTSIWNFINDNITTIRTPRFHKEMFLKIYKLERQYGEDLSGEFLSEKLGFTPERIKEIKDIAYKSQAISLNTPIYKFDDSESGELINTIEDTESYDNLNLGIDIQNKKEYILDKMEKLTERERAVLFFTFFAYEHYTLEDISFYLGCSRERIRQIQLKAIRKIKWYISKDIDSEFYKKYHISSIYKNAFKTNFLNYNELKNIADIIKETIVGKDSVTIKEYISLVKKTDMKYMGWMINKAIQNDIRLAAFLPKEIYQIIKTKIEEVPRFSVHDYNFIKENSHRGCEWLSQKMYCGKKKLQGYCYYNDSLDNVPSQSNIHKYSEKEEEFIEENKEMGIQWIADQLGMTYNAVRNKAVRLGITFSKQCVPYSEEDIDFILKNVKSKGYEWVAEKLGRTPNAIRTKYATITEKHTV